VISLQCANVYMSNRSQKRSSCSRVTQAVSETDLKICAVYKAQNTSTGQFAAVKAIAADKIAQEKILLALQSEISILRSVIHPNIVKLLDYYHLKTDPEGRPALTHYLVLEYCDGGDLADFLESRKRTGSKGLDEDTTRRLLRMLAMGLREMHSRNIVHVCSQKAHFPDVLLLLIVRDHVPRISLRRNRATKCFLRSFPCLIDIKHILTYMQRDLKPGNILLASQGAHVTLKIADFGFARALEPAHLASTLCGSPLYMAPEVLSEQRYDSRSDLWSVGVMMFEMLVGHVPFSGNNIVHLKKVIDSNEAFLPFDRRDQLSPACQVWGFLQSLLQSSEFTACSCGDRASLTIAHHTTEPASYMLIRLSSTNQHTGSLFILFVRLRMVQCTRDLML
jgi:serine/threonine protein kinase